MPIILLAAVLFLTTCGPSAQRWDNPAWEDPAWGPPEGELLDGNRPTSLEVTFRESGIFRDPNQTDCSPFHRALYDGVGTGSVVWGCADVDGVFLTLNGNIPLTLSAEGAADLNHKLSTVVFGSVKSSYALDPLRPDETMLTLTLVRGQETLTTRFPTQAPVDFPQDLSAAMAAAAEQNLLLGAGFMP